MTLPSPQPKRRIAWLQQKSIPDVAPIIPHISLLIVVLIGLILPLPLLASPSLHPDEALYIHWGQLISSGQDPMLNSVPVDKPPLLLYILAQCFRFLGVSETVGRLPSLLAQAGTIALTFALGKRLYHHRIGLLAAVLVAVSPYHLLFAPTAFTDPLMTLFVMLACWLAVDDKPELAGLCLGLAAATKQQGVLFLPLVMGLIWLCQTRSNGKRLVALVRCLIIFFIALSIPLIWDANRTYETGFWLQSSQSYGGLALTIPHLLDRLSSFGALLYLMTDSPVLSLIFGGGVIILAVVGWWQRQSEGPYPVQAKADGLLFTFCLVFILLHALFTFQIWDRYLLGLLPLLGLLLSRVLHIPEMVLKSRQGWVTFIGLILVIVLMMRPVQTAISGDYPLGGDRGSYYGMAEVTTYLRGHAGANVTLYHRWLGTHWRYYLFRFPYDLRFWQTPEDLADQAEANATGTQYIGFPSWQSTTPTILALHDVGLGLKLIYRTYRPDSTPAIYLYQIVPIE